MKTFLEKVFFQAKTILEKRVFGERISLQTIFVVLALFGALLFFQKEINLQSNSDDMIMYDRVHQISYTEWVSEMYLGTGGRVAYTSALYVFLHLPIWVEKVVNALMILLFVYGVNRLFARQVRMSDFIFVLCLFGFIGQRILTSSTFAIHAAPNYFWPITLGIWALIPLADAFFRREAQYSQGMLALFGAGLTYAVFSNEQTTVILFGFYGLFLFLSWLQKKKIPVQFFIYFLIICASLLNTFLSPGTSTRYASEIVRWYPEYANMSWENKIERGGVWFFKKFFSEQWYLVLLLGGMTALAYWKRLQKRNFLLEFLVFFPIALFLMRGIQSFDEVLFEFNKSKDFAWGDVGMYVYWIVYLGVLLYTLFKIDEKKWLYPIILCAGIGTMLLMILSPTIYASANRILLVNSVLLIVLINGIRMQCKISVQKYLFMFALLAVVHLATLFALWERKGFHIYY